jgi:cytochrome c-type biogenesis protein
VFPLIPAYIGYLGGSVVTEARTVVKGGGVAGATVNVAAARWLAFTHALMFVLGFTFVFTVLIGSMAGALSDLLRANRALLQWAMGIVLIIFGLNSMGILKIPFLDYTKRLDLRPAHNLGYLRSFIIGTAFAIGWTPCIGYWLGILISMALNGEPGQAFVPFLAYSIGLGLPFLVAGVAMGQVSGALKKLSRRSYSFRIGNYTLIDDVNIIALVSGIILVIMGLLIMTNTMAIFASFGLPFDLQPGT